MRFTQRTLHMTAIIIEMNTSQANKKIEVTFYG